MKSTNQIVIDILGIVAFFIVPMLVDIIFNML